MKSFKQFLGEDKAPEKLTREAFIFMMPKAPKDYFAECQTCIHFIEDDKSDFADEGTAKDKDRCKIMGPDVKVEENWSCGLYVHGEQPKGKVIPLKLVSPTEAGLVKHPVRCENCYSFDAEKNTCALYEDLNKKLPDYWDLDTKVHPKACCNAWSPK